MLKNLSQRDLKVKEEYDKKATGKDLLNRLKGLNNPIHHHYGLGKIKDINAVLKTGDKAISAAMYKLETNQVKYLTAKIRPYINKKSMVLDCGSGSGGTAFMLAQKFGCEVHGVNISTEQIKLTSKLAKERELNRRVFFHEANMLDLPFAPNSFDVAINNETTMYVPLSKLYPELRKVLKSNGVYATMDWVTTQKGSSSVEVRKIDKHYHTKMHILEEYSKELEKNRFKIISFEDLTERALDYWLIRERFKLASGIEGHFIKAYKNNLMKYVFHLARKTD